MAEMTLQEAIDHAREVANGLHPNIDGCSECAKQHGQLADWLEELQAFKRVGTTPVDVRPAAEILNAVDEAIIFLNNASNQMPYHVYSELYDLIYEICPNCGADMRGGDADGEEKD